MTIAITGATGHIGGAAARVLLDRGHDVVLLVRNAAALDGTPLERARVIEGVLEDAAYVTRATAGVEALFWLTPPQLAAPVLRDWQEEVTRHVVAAVTSNRIPRVVNLSGLGAGRPDARGLIRTLGDIEAALDATSTRVTHLRPGWFMENLDPQVPAALAGSPLHVAIGADVPLPLIATRDIGEVAAAQLEQLADAPHHLSLIGPDVLTGRQVAATFGQVGGQDVAWASLPPAEVGTMLRGVGASEDAAQAYVALFEDFNRTDGPYSTLPADAVRTRTSLREWLAGRVPAPAAR